MADIILIGAGSQAKAIVSAARLSGMNVCAIYDDDCARWGQLISGVPIVGSLALAPSSGLPGILGFDAPQRRKAVARSLDVRWTTVVHPKAFLDPSASVGAGSVILEGVVAQADVDVRQHVVVSANVTISHDAVVEDFAQLWAGVVLAGSVRIGEGSCLETGALVIPNIRIAPGRSLGHAP